ncbi:chromatin accessibility complex protein 1-like [Salvia divinorum]|uniref:Chromatin accessibility complex protein 1-like n=1 Tax=Salvia divinorum TaxID=28513 RepID=A0ABD1H205_SALDI
MAEQEEGENPAGIDETNKLEIPTRRVKNIMKLDRDISKVNAEALFLVSSSTQLFLQFLAEKSAHAAVEKKRKTITLEHIRLAAKRHRPTADFLLDSLPVPTEQNHSGDRAKSRPDKKPVPFATRSIDAFFQKTT